MATPLPIGKSFNSEINVIQDGIKSSFSTSNISFSRKTVSPFPSNDIISSSTRSKTKKRISFSREEDCHGKRANQCFQISRTEESSVCKEVFSPVFYASESDSTEKHKSSLELYMEKLQSQAKQVSARDNESEMDDQSSDILARKELGLLEEYLNSLREDAKSERCLPSTSDRNTSAKFGESSIIRKKSNIYTRKASSSSSMYDEKESANLYLTSTLLSTNIAVFLFEIASPVKSSDYNLVTLPMVYGAKVNELIMVGEWWRLVTPMFLGPVFAVIGAWLVYQVQNKDVIPKELSDSMFQKAVMATALSFLLVNFGAMDNWTSLGAAVSGIIYGFCTSPVAKVDDASSGLQERSGGMKEEITLNSTKAASPCKSLVIFTVFVTALSSLLFLVESPLDNLEFEELVQIIE
ncbi:RHOMBOID-like protein 9 chloroplastic [Bienertia sinuspersici]